MKILQRSLEWGTHASPILVLVWKKFRHMRLGEASNCSFRIKFLKRPSVHVHKNTQC